MSMNVWETSGDLLARHLAHAAKLDVLLEMLPSQMTARERRRSRHLLYGAVRHRRLLDHVVHHHLQRRPRPRLHAALLLGSFELLEHPENAPAIVHHAVERTREWTSAAEARVVNAVLRRIPAALQTELERTPRAADEYGLRFSHPTWLVARWLSRWGEDVTRQLLEWDQQPAAAHARALTADPLPSFFVATAWPNFFRLERPDWDEVERLLAAGAIYLQDPATSIAPDLLAVNPGETVLDLCAAPGGKTLQLAARVGTGGRVVAADLPGARLERLRENIARYPHLPISVIAMDAATINSAALTAAGAPATFDAILIDVPCSNTGVLRHRVDAKWRLDPAEMTTLPPRQFEMLLRASELVGPGGRLVYSTCSLETEENEDVVHRLLEARGSTFTLERAIASLPWVSGCDGAGAFLLRREN